MPANLTQGTKEYLLVDVTDMLGNLLTLDGATPKFDVKDSQGNLKYSQIVATNVGMRLYCLIDTSAAHPDGLWAGGNYRIYINFATAPELPRLGPFAFTVDAS